MELTFQCSQFVVFDDVLSAAQFESLWRYFQLIPFKPFNYKAPYSSWHITDGHPLRGSSAHAASQWAGSEPPPRTSSNGEAYPTGTPLDQVLEKLLGISSFLQPWIGLAGTDWVVCSATPMIYPSGSALSWHADGAGYTGAYTYYAHPEWDVHWGGELLVAHESCRLSHSSSSEMITHSIEDSDASRFGRCKMSGRLLHTGVGRVVMSKPNRLVVLQGGNPHKIARVDAAVGDRVRVSIAGFFASQEMLSQSRSLLNSSDQITH